MELEELRHLAAKEELSGLYEGIIDEAYHAGPGINKSGLAKIERSPAHFKTTSYKKPGPALLIGKAAHAFILEPETFTDRFVVSPGFDRRTKIGKADFAVFTEENKGKDLVSPDTMEMLRGIKESLSRHSLGADMFTGGRAELSGYWIDSEFGVLCKCRPDYYDEKSNVLIDLKTTEDASPRMFGRSITDYKYYMQAAFYTDGIEQITGKKLKPFTFCAVEKGPPYGVKITTLNPYYLEIGRHFYRKALKKYTECLIADHWPNYSEDIAVLMPPQWLDEVYKASVVNDDELALQENIAEGEFNEQLNNATI